MGTDKLEDSVIYAEGRTNLSKHYIATLRWTADDHIVLTASQKEGPDKLIFSTPLSKLRSVSGGSSSLRFDIGDAKKYRVSMDLFSERYPDNTPSTNDPGEILIEHFFANKLSHAGRWVKELRACGIKGYYFTLYQLWGMGAAIAIIFMGLILLASFLIEGDI